MSHRPQVTFARIATPAKGAVVVLAADGMSLGEAARTCNPDGVLERAAKINDFKGALAATLDVVAPSGTDFDRLVAVGAGKPAELKEEAWLRIGGVAFAASRKSASVSVVLDLPDTDISADDAANVGLGILLRSYAFDKYKTKKSDGEDGKKPKPARFTILCADPAGAKRAFEDLEGVGEGVLLARELVNEPANVLGPVEFADRAAKLESLGVKIEILGEKEMKKLGMGALLGVAQGSAKPPRLVVMQWKDRKSVV